MGFSLRTEAGMSSMDCYRLRWMPRELFKGLSRRFKGNETRCQGTHLEYVIHIRAAESTGFSTVSLMMRNHCYLSGGFVRGCV